MSKTPRILHVSTPVSWRGGEQQLVYLYHELEKRGVYQFILCRKNSELQAYCQKHDIPHKAISRSSSLDPRFAQKLALIANDQKIDLVHAHDSHAHTFCIMAADLWKMKKQIVLHRKVDYAVGRSVMSRYKYNHKQIAAIICVSDEVRKVLSASLNQPEKCHVIHDGIDLERFGDGSGDILRKEYSINTGTFLVGNVAAVTQQKDYFTFVDAAEIVAGKRSDVHFMAIGDGDQMKAMQDYTEKKGLLDQFTFTGFRNDIKDILPELDLLLFSSEKEGLGTTILDAYAAGVPVVATNAGGIPELIVHGQTGYLGQVKDPESLAKGVLELLNNKSKRLKIIEKASEHVKQFSKEETARKTEMLYRELI